VTGYRLGPCQRTPQQAAARRAGLEYAEEVLTDNIEAANKTA
jgi:hypothetical protein